MRPLTFQRYAFCAVLAGALLFLGSGQRTLAQLKWERTSVELAPAVGTESADAEFAFSNEGKTPVTILLVKPNCSCTTASVDKKTYAPGEKGKIRAKITFGDREGAHTTLILVLSKTQAYATSGGGNSNGAKPADTVTLKMNVAIPKREAAGKVAEAAKP